MPKTFATTPLFHPLQLMNANKGVFGINVGHLWDERALMQEALKSLAQKWEAGEIDPVIDSTFPFEKAGEAHLRLENRRNFGKVVLVP